MTSGGLYRVGPFVAVAGLLALLSGCGKFRFEEREPWRAEAERQCLRSGAVQSSWAIEKIGAISGPGTWAFMPARLADGRRCDEHTSC